MLNQHTEPENQLSEYFRDPANAGAAAAAVRAALESPGPLMEPGSLSMLPGSVRSSFVRVFGESGSRRRAVLTLDFVERVSAYFPVSSRKSLRAARCLDLAEAMLRHLEEEQKAGGQNEDPERK